MKNLSKEEVFALIEEKVLPIIKKYLETRSVIHIKNEDSKSIRQVWSFIAPTSYYNGSCPSCIKAVLDMIDSWYGREKKKWEIAHPELIKVDTEISIPEEKGDKEREDVVLKNQEGKIVNGNEEVPSIAPVIEKPVVVKKKRTMSDETKKKIAEAQKNRHRKNKR